MCLDVGLFPFICDATQWIFQFFSWGSFLELLYTFYSSLCSFFLELLIICILDFMDWFSIFPIFLSHFSSFVLLFYFLGSLTLSFIRPILVPEVSHTLSFLCFGRILMCKSNWFSRFFTVSFWFRFLGFSSSLATVCPLPF